MAAGKKHPTLYGLVGLAAKIGGLVGASVVLILGSFQGLSGWALASRVALAFLGVTIVLSIVGLVTVRSLLTAIVTDGEERKLAAEPKRGR